MNKYSKAFVETIAACTAGYRKATKYLDSKTVVKVSRKHPPSVRESSMTFILTFGRPNYAERKFIKLCQKAGEPFPVKKLQLRSYREKRKEAN